MSVDVALLILNGAMLPVLIWGLEKLIQIERRLTRLETKICGE